MITRYSDSKVGITTYCWSKMGTQQHKQLKSFRRPILHQGRVGGGVRQGIGDRLREQSAVDRTVCGTRLCPWSPRVIREVSTGGGRVPGKRRFCACWCEGSRWVNILNLARRHTRLTEMTAKSRIIPCFPVFSGMQLRVLGQNRGFLGRIGNNSLLFSRFLIRAVNSTFR